MDCNHLLDNIYVWTTQEIDFQATLFYLLTSLECLNNNGSMIIKLNFYASCSWTIIFDILYSMFKEFTFYRPKIVNPLNPEIYLFLDKFCYKQIINSVFNKLLKSLYKQKNL